MDLRAVKAAGRAQLCAYAFAAARNALGLLRDAEILAGSASTARAYSLAVLAVEECGKAGYVSVLAVLPKSVRRQAPAGRMLEWHQLKLLGGLLIAAMSFDEPGLAAKVAAMPAAQVTQILNTLGAPADEADRLKRRGLYVDMDRTGRIRDPAEITEAELISQLDRARQATASAAVLLGPEARARLANPPKEAIALASALVNALAQAGNARTPESAADVIMNAISELRDTMAMKNAQRAAR